MCTELRLRFPGLSSEQFEKKSKATREYNCIAWAVGDNTRRWDPYSPDGYWPYPVPPVFTVPVLMAVFTGTGYTECDSGDYEAGYEKVALYGFSEDNAQHAARQVGPNRWWSKCGDYEDIWHTLDGLVGAEYGKVLRFMRRPTQGS